MADLMQMTPSDIVSELNKHIIGQREAKRAVAVALRNRWRRQQVKEPLRHEITPKNIMMIGQTGVGKTEIARRLAKLARAPFIKVEATKFTEVGYVGRDVDSIIRDLMEIAVKEMREKSLIKVQEQAQILAQERILDILVYPTPDTVSEEDKNEAEDGEADKNGSKTDKKNTAARQLIKKRLLEHQLDEKEIEIDLEQSAHNMEILGPPGMEEMTEQIKNMFSHLGSSRKKRKKLKIIDAMRLLTDEEASKLINEDEIKLQSIRDVEQNGIVFLDEIDKIASRTSGSGADISRQGVQRDLLPLVEGTTVSTKYGMIKTDHILFIASGAFHEVKPSALTPELQGRFPIRVELQSLSVEDFESILTKTDACLVKQYQALLATEKVILKFEEKGIRRMAEIAYEVNERTENIGARRLYTVIEKLLEEISFEASLKTKRTIVIDADYVDTRLNDLAKNEDLSRYVL